MRLPQGLEFLLVEVVVERVLLRPAVVVELRQLLVAEDAVDQLEHLLRVAAADSGGKLGQRADALLASWYAAADPVIVVRCSRS
jgi:hypothetical protein